MPPIIAAPDYCRAEDIKSLIQQLSAIDSQSLGVKIPDWHNQNKELLKMLVDQGRYVILDTAIHNTVNKMQIACEAFLGQAVLPTAITLNPVKQVTSEGSRALKELIVDPAHNIGVQVIGYTEHDDLEDSDYHFMEREAGRYKRGAGAGIDAFEVHASTFRSEYFDETKRSISANSELILPKTIVSKHTGGIQNYDIIIEQTVSVLKEVADGATKAHLPADSVYMGESLMSTSDPCKLISRILEKLYE